MLTTKSKSGIPTRAEQELTARMETMIWQHIDVARQIASHARITQKDAREAFFNADHKDCVEYHQKWPKWTGIWQLSLAQMHAIIQKSEGKKQRLQQKAYDEELLRRLSVAGTYDVIAPDAEGDRRRWCVALSVYFFWENPERLVPLLQQRVNQHRDKPDLGLTDYLFFLAPPSKEARERKEKAIKAEQARQLELARQRAEEEQKRKKKEREEKAAKRMEAVLAGEIKPDTQKTEAQEPVIADANDVDELASMLDPFAEFDMSKILKGDEND